MLSLSVDSSSKPAIMLSADMVSACFSNLIVPGAQAREIFGGPR